MKCHKNFHILIFLVLILIGIIFNGLAMSFWNDDHQQISNIKYYSLPNSAQGRSITPGEVVMGTTDGYNWWSYVPENLKKSDTAYILLEMSYNQIENYTTLTNDAKQNVINWISLAEFKRYIILTAVVPRNFSERYYPQGINRNSLEPSTPEFYYRPDLKVNNIISELMNNLTDAGYAPCEKVLVAGFSAGGMWANRYTLLHPERVLAAAIGHAGGWLSMPLVDYNSSLLNWPMGINDFDILTGTSYNKTEILKEVPQFIFIGDLDTSSTYCNEGYPYCDNITIWGTTDPERLESQYEYLNEHDFNVRFKLYEGVSHEYTLVIKNDILDFFNDVIRENIIAAIPGFNFPILLLLSLVALSFLTLIHKKKYNLMM